MHEPTIVLHREIPPALVKLAHKEFGPHPIVRQIIFAGDCAELVEGHMAVFVPDTGSVVIDLDACVQDLRWMDKGATFIANAWFNVLYCIFHEAQHAWQVSSSAPESEENADNYALDRMFEWVEANGMPQLDEMAYVGERIKVVLNAMWAKHESIVENEIKACGVAAADAMCAASKEPTFENQKQIAALDTEIREGKVGHVLNGRAYLRADEFLALGSKVDASPEKLAKVLVALFAERITAIRKGERV